MNAPAFPGGSTSRLTAAGKPRRFQKVVKNLTTRITVIRRFGKKYSTTSFQCCIAPALAGEVISRVQDLIEKSNPSENFATKNQPAGSAPKSSEALFGLRHNAPAQNAPKQKVQKQQNGEGFFLKASDVFKDNRGLSTLQILLALFSLQIGVQLFEDLPDESTSGLVVIVTVIVLTKGMEGTTATNDLSRGVTRNVLTLILLLCSSSFVISGAHAQDDSEEGALKYPNEEEKLPFYLKAAAWTLLAFYMAAQVIALNRRRLVQVPPPAPPAPAVPVNIDDLLMESDDPTTFEIYPKL